MRNGYLIRQNLNRLVLLAVVCLSLSACTYGPVKQRVVMDQVVRPEDSYTGYVLLETMEFREPTGFINTFPNGGKLRILSQNARVYEVHAQDLSLQLLADLPADNATWVSFSGHIVGFDDKNAPYLQMSGCEKGGECYGDLMNFKYFHLHPDGKTDSLSALPPNDGLPSLRGSRRQGEVNYVRFSIRRDTLKAKFQEEGDYMPLFITDEEGNLTAVR